MTYSPGRKRTLGLAVGLCLLPALVSSCDTGEARMTGEVSLIRPGLFCVVAEDKYYGVACVSADPALLSQVSVGDCVEMKVTPIDGQFGTIKRPASVSGYKELERRCEPPKELTVIKFRVSNRVVRNMH